MNLPIQGSVDPKEDTHNKEDITEVKETLFTQRECLHDYQVLGGDLAECRRCGHRKRFTNYRGSDRIMVRFEDLPEAFQSVYVPREMLHQYLLDHFDRYFQQKGRLTDAR